MKKLLTLLTLVLCVCSGAWAENISCSATVPAGQTGTFSNTEGIAANGCTLKYEGLQGGNNVVTVNSVDYYKMGSNTAYVQLILNSGSFQAGDELKAQVTSNGGSSAKTVDVKVGNSATSTVSVKGTETKTITYTLTAADIESDGSIKIYRNTNGSNLRVAVFSVTGTRVTEAFTVTFNAGSNGTCATASLTEASAGAGVTLPAVTANSGYVFNGWYTAASGGTKAGDAGSTYNPTANVTLYAQYSVLSAPTISVGNTNVETMRGTAVTFTATTTGAPAPTVTWYQNESASTTGGTEKGTGATYSPDVTAEGTFYYYAVARNGVNPDATSNLITLTVTNPDVTLSGNNYYVAVDDQVVPEQNIICDDITMQFVNTKGGFNAGSKDETVKSLVSGFVAQISGDGVSNGWSAKFTPAKSGSLKVGVIINKDKKFTITNVTGFSYQAKNPDASGVIDANEWTPSDKIYGVITIAVNAGTEYSFSVAGSKMGLYGFEFTPNVDVTVPATGFTTYVNSANALNFEGTGITPYVIKTNTDATKVSLVAKTSVAAGEPVLLYADGGATKSVPVAATATADADNLLKAGTGAKVKYSDTDQNYILWTNGDGVTGFYRANSTDGNTVAVGKAYLHIPSGSGARFFSLDLDGETTAINSVNVNVNENGCFDLQGRRVAQPTKGLYIVNGKKVVIK